MLGRVTYAVSLHERASRTGRDAADGQLQRHLPQLHAFVRVRLGAGLHARESSLDMGNSGCRDLLSARDAVAFRSEDRFRPRPFAAPRDKVRNRHRRPYAGRRDVAREPAGRDLDSLAAIAPMRTPSQARIGRENKVLLHLALVTMDEDRREVTLARLVQLLHRAVAAGMGRSEAATRKLLARATRQQVHELRQRGVDVERWSVT